MAKFKVSTGEGGGGGKSKSNAGKAKPPTRPTAAGVLSNRTYLPLVQNGAAPTQPYMRDWLNSRPGQPVRWTMPTPQATQMPYMRDWLNDRPGNPVRWIRRPMGGRVGANPYLTTNGQKSRNLEDYRREMPDVIPAAATGGGGWGSDYYPRGGGGGGGGYTGAAGVEAPYWWGPGLRDWRFGVQY